MYRVLFHKFCNNFKAFSLIKYSNQHITVTCLPKISNTRGTCSLYLLHFLKPCIVAVTNFMDLSTVLMVKVSPLELAILSLNKKTKMIINSITKKQGEKIKKFPQKHVITDGFSTLVSFNWLCVVSKDA